MLGTAIRRWMSRSFTGISAPACMESSVDSGELTFNSGNEEQSPRTEIPPFPGQCNSGGMARLFSPCTSTRALLFSLVEAKGEYMPVERIELPQGTLDLLILRTLALEPQHGWAISERIQQISSDVLRVQQGSLYPALHRLERRGWIKARWGTSENNRRAKYYELTKTGRKQLEVEKDAWDKLTAAVAQVLGTA
jgi:PadR family transcriptional regulator PadR